MSRYYYYLILINMVANVIASVPAILLQFHKQGSVSSMILAAIIGTILITIYTRFFNAFPGMTLPDLLKKTTAKWFYNPFILLLALVWFIAGLITLVTFAFLLIRFVTPEMPIIQIGSTIILSVIFGCLMRSERVLYTIELVTLITFPLTIFIFYKAYTSDNLNWDFVKDAALYVNQMPNLNSFGACLFLFLGVVNLFIFNRFFTEKQSFKWKHAALIGVISTMTLFTTYFIPIGFHGFENIDELVYPWISTSDSIRMEFFIIERVLFVFILFYLGIAFLSILIHWHVSMEFLKFVFHLEKIKFRGLTVGTVIPLPFFIGISLYFLRELNEYQLFRISGLFYDSLIFFFSLITILLFFIKRRMKNARQAKEY
ncbi:GerAB/ArcD/ProY family transporter [Ureibacillus sinduriensis]|uniref:MFS transporter permease n=1 Tax=Ureibacillus sinduriensis BLB-1 = JCM 15800 TaxID=1384057 RepID=A0A0A3I267_9BACL|nr:GerAB/ArcD/ProY family transporter [Ureibacillus sinduriensis]KGR78774.1 MFS transporter permease [Ureibacillus sinduriensis BLB-1 = JCM 15800]